MPSLNDTLLALAQAQNETARRLDRLERQGTSPSGAGPSGTVTSIGLSAPSWLTVSGSPITTYGTLALSATSQAINTVLAGPASGGSGAPTFRALVAADFPAGMGLGTVTQVGLAMPAIFSVTGTPVTSSGTLTAALANQAGHAVFIGPNSGTPAAPTFRALVVQDLPATVVIQGSLLPYPSGIFDPNTGGGPGDADFNLNFLTQTANLIFAGPATGAAVEPSFRAMVTADIPAAAVTYAKIQNMASSRLLGRTTAGAGVVEEIAIGAGLTLSAGTLAATGTGTVTSVALSLPAIFSVSGSPITGAGTLTGTLATQTANYIWAGPTSGGAAAPTFRALVALDMAASVVGTSGTIAKFTGTNVVGNSIMTESGSTVTTTGAHTITGTLQAGTKIIDITRTVAGGAIGNYTEIGNFSNTYGAHALRVNLVASQSGVSIAKEYMIVTKTAQTSSWVLVPADKDTGYNGYDVHVVAMQSGAALNLRIVCFRNNNPANIDFNVCVENVGWLTDTWTATSATGSMTVPTALLVTSTDQHAIGGGYVMTRAIPTTVGNYIEICSFNGVNGNGAVEVVMSNVDGGFVISKRFFISMTYNFSGAWCIVNPISSTGAYSGNDCALVALQNSTSLSLRILRTSGTTAGTMVVYVSNAGDYAHFFDEASGTGTMTAPTIFHPSAMITQVNGKTGINVINPLALWHVVGAADVVQEIVKANATQTSDLTQWQDSSATVLAKVTGAGKLIALAPVAANASINLPAGTAPSSPVAGDVWHDSTRKAQYSFLAGISQASVGAIFTATANKTVTNTITETSLFGTGIGTATLPANFWTVGKTVRVRMWGYITSAGAILIKIKTKLGSVVIIDGLSAASGKAWTNAPVVIQYDLTCRTTGASGTMMGQGWLYFDNAAISIPSIVNTATVTIDTTASALLDTTMNWGTANASESITITNTTVEVLQ